MGGDIGLAIEREPDFYALARARGDPRTHVAEIDGRVVGCGTVSVRPAWVLGSRARIGYVADLRVLPSHRRSGVARALLSGMAATELDRPVLAYVGSVAAGNRVVTELLGRLAPHRPVLRLASFTAYQLLRLGGSAPKPEVAIARPADAEELTSLLDAFYRHYSLAPVFGDGGIADLNAPGSSDAIADYRLLRRGGRIVAAAALCDTGALKQTRVRRLPIQLRWAGRLTRSLPRALALPRLPAEGEVLRHSYIRHPAHLPGERGALSVLVHALVREAAEAGCHFAIFDCAAGDPIAGCVRGVLRTRYHYDLYASPGAHGSAALLEEVCHGLVYDDAALA